MHRVYALLLAASFGLVGCQEHVVAPVSVDGINASVHPPEEVLTIAKAEYRAKSTRLVVDTYSTELDTYVYFYGLDADGNKIALYRATYDYDKKSKRLLWRIRQKTTPGPIYVKAQLGIFLCTPVCDTPIGDSVTAYVVWR